MGHGSALVIGDDPMDQLSRFESPEYAEPTNRHFVLTDVTEQVRAQNALWCAGPQARPSWMRPYDGRAVLAPGQAPDLAGAHQWGWVRPAPDGAILEAFYRTIPDGFIEWFEGTRDGLTLKPGASGLSIDANGNTQAVTGRAGSARKRDVDLADLCQPRDDGSARWWNRAMQACGARPWESRRDIRARLVAPGNGDAIDDAATAAWALQPSVSAICAAALADKPSDESLAHYGLAAPLGNWRPHVCLEVDRLLLPRARYVATQAFRRALYFGEIIHDGELIEPVDLVGLIESLADDVLLTLVRYHC